MLTLIVKEGAAPVTLQLSEDVVAIGRSKENNIVLKNIKASRRHARIERIGATYQITDLGSGNGTKVNGKKIDFQSLKKGDEIAIGDARITLKGIDDGPDAMDADEGVPEEIKLQDETDSELKIAEESETEKIEWSEAETEVQAPAVKAKPSPGKPAAKPGAKPAPAPAPKPGLKKPLGKPGQK
jgi:pSer/pThr/pTyr-binding forkhead associated (FHA) protein